MEARAYLKYLRISPRKVVILCDLIRGKDVKTATAYLMQTPKAASEPMLKLLKSCCERGEQPRHERRQSGCHDRHRQPGPHAQARYAQSAGQIQSHSEENHSHHHRCEREGLSRRLLWVRKLIPMGCALA